MKKLPDLYRIRYDHILTEKGKRYVDNINLIFKGEVELTEKIDGSQMAVSFKGGMPYLQSKNAHLPMNGKHPAFSGAWSWVWEHIEKIEKLKDVLLFGEWVKVQHSIPYDNLPDWFIVFDGWHRKQKRYMDRRELRKFTQKTGFTTAPVLYQGRIEYRDVPALIENKKPTWSSSRYLNDLKFNDEELERIKNATSNKQPIRRFENGTINMEGCVIKPAQNPKTKKIGKETIVWYNAGKVVVQAFLNETESDADWMGHKQRFNRLAEWN